MTKVKKLPYGIADFETVMKDNLYYVDKTMYIPLIEEQPNYLMFIRPCRFGKSLLLSMLKTYYDKAKKDQFEEIFGSLWIGKHPTPLMGRYQVMHLDFSSIGDRIEQLRKELDAHLCNRLDDFVKKYADDYPDYFIKEFFEATSGDEKLLMITTTAGRLRIPIFVFIDGFDDVSNGLFGEDITDDDISSTEQVFVDFFNKIKGTVERIFITGISPILFYNQGGGFNFGWNMSAFSDFDKLLGFTADDLRKMFTYYKSVGAFPADCDLDAIIAEMKLLYGNYCFADSCLTDGNPVFNSEMVLYYLSKYVEYGQTPDVVLDLNIKADFNRIKRLIKLDTQNVHCKKELRGIIEKGEIKSSVEPSFFVSEIVKPRMFISLLFYYGMLTIKGKYGAQLILGIPNNHVRDIIENLSNYTD